jgi:hypothetical protein
MYSARNLRSKDRSKCKGHYPRVHYPELYILEGGYAGLYNDKELRVRSSCACKHFSDDLCSSSASRKATSR